MSVIRETTSYEKSMGNIFYEIITHFFDDKVSSIVEFAPGFRSKISYALEKLDYDGDLYVIDSNKEVLKYIKETYSKTIPKANIITIDLDLKNCANKLPSNIDLFLSNHCFDDIIISKYISSKNLESLFDNNEDTYNSLNNCWLELDNNKELLETYQSEVYNEMIDLFNKVDFKYIIMNNYNSWFYFKINNIPEKHAMKVFNMIKNDFNKLYNIKDVLNNIEFISDEKLDGSLSIEDNILNDNNWIVGEYK